MNLPDTISSLEDAKVFYQCLGCSGFHMLRENEELYRQYKAVGVSEDLEKSWRLESISKYLNLLEQETNDPSELLTIHSNVAQLILDGRNISSLERLLDATRKAARHASKFHCLIMAETIVGDQSPIDRKALPLFDRMTGHPMPRRGLLLFAYDSGRHRLAREYALLAGAMAATPLTPEDGAELPLKELRDDLESRRLCLLSELESTVQACRPDHVPSPQVSQKSSIDPFKRSFDSIRRFFRQRVRRMGGGDGD